MTTFLVLLSALAMAHNTWHQRHHPTPTPVATATPTPRATATPSPTPTATATPTPTATVTATPSSIGRPVGAVYLLATDQPISDKQPCWKNAGVKIVRLRVSAGAIKSAADKDYDWSMLDAASAQAKASGKQWTAGVQWGGPSTPAWIGAKTYPLSQGAAPAPWDEKLLAVHLAFIKAFGARYNSDPTLAGVIMGGLGANTGFESYVAKTDADAALLPGGATEWTASCKTIVAAYVAAFPNKAIIMAAGKPFPRDDDSLKALVDSQMASYPSFGVMSCSLKKDSAIDYMPNQLVNSYALSHPCGFQFVASTKDSRTGGTLAEVCAAGENLLQHRGFIEIYASDADNAANSATLAAVDGDLK